MNTCPLGEIVKWASIFIGKVNVSWAILGRYPGFSFSQWCCKSLVPRNRLSSRPEPKSSPWWESLILPEHTRFCYCLKSFSFFVINAKEHLKHTRRWIFPLWRGEKGRRVGEKLWSESSAASQFRGELSSHWNKLQNFYRFYQDQKWS